jgi:CRISPR/Cas system-associated protein Cas10 (large subunit of type III CRISPR-Cas system)
VLVDLTKENFERAVNESKELSVDEKKLLHKILNGYYKDAAKIRKTKGHDGEAYLGISDGIKTGTIDHMFTNDDGGAVQYITPFDADTLIKLGILKQIK